MQGKMEKYGVNFKRAYRELKFYGIVDNYEIEIFRFFVKARDFSIINILRTKKKNRLDERAFFLNQLIILLLNNLLFKLFLTHKIFNFRNLLDFE